MDGARHQVLAGAGFAGHQHVQIGRRHTHDVLAQRYDAVAVADDAQVALLRLTQPAQHPLQTLGGERLGEELADTELMRTALGLARVVAGHHHDLRSVVRVEPLDQVEAAAVGQADVDHQQIGKLLSSQWLASPSECIPLARKPLSVANSTT